MTSLVQALKNKRLVILAEHLMGLGILLPALSWTRGRPPSGLPGGSGRGWDEEGGGRAVSASVQCLAGAGQPVVSEVNANQTDGLGAWEHRSVTGNSWCTKSQMPAGRRGSALFRGSNPAWRTDLA